VECGEGVLPCRRDPFPFAPDGHGWPNAELVAVSFSLGFIATLRPTPRPAARQERRTPRDAQHAAAAQEEPSQSNTGLSFLAASPSPARHAANRVPNPAMANPHARPADLTLIWKRILSRETYSAVRQRCSRCTHRQRANHLRCGDRVPRRLEEHCASPRYRR
jgi:hypothetical protein